MLSSHGLKKETYNINNQGALENFSRVPVLQKTKVFNMDISISSNEQKENLPPAKNALLIRVKAKLPKPIKEKLKRAGAIWLEVYQGYGIPIEQKETINRLLQSSINKVSISEECVDPQRFSSMGKVKNNRELRISILEQQIQQESLQLLCDIHRYDPTLSEYDFDKQPSLSGKTAAQIEIEVAFYEKRQGLLEKKEELRDLIANASQNPDESSPFFLDEQGLWYVHEGEKSWISSPLYVTARIRDVNGMNHGKLLEFDDADGVHHIWSMPMTLLAGDCAELRKSLLNAGLEISTSPKMRQFLAEFIQRSSPSITARCIHRTGWHKGSFILPDGNIGNLGQEKMFVQGPSSNLQGYCSAGTLLDWQKNVAHPCVGNSRLIFSLSVGFGSPLLSLLGLESGGFQLTSPSSSGKTTAMRVAVSLYGSEEFMRKWKSTLNGLETIAFLHNDLLLCLDEIGEMSPYEIGDAAYMLANGSGKNRSRADQGLRDTMKWKLLFLSTGEISLATHMEQAGKAAKAGQEIRLADIPADTGAYGMFEELHGMPNGSVFSDTLSANAKRYYGVAGREFLKRLVHDTENAKTFVKRAIERFLQDAIPEKANGQVHRVAARFAVVAAAGELAIHYNIVRVLDKDGLASIGWDEGNAHLAVLKCFQDWLEAFGGEDLREEAAIIADTQYFLDKNGESWFTNWYANPLDVVQPPRTHNRAGYRKHVGNEVEYYIFPETFKREICKGRQEKFVKQVLFDKGYLMKDPEGKYSCPASPPAEGKSRRFYVIRAVGD